MSKETNKKLDKDELFEFNESQIFNDVFPEIKPNYDSIPILEVKNLSVVFRNKMTKFKAVKNVSFDIYKGEVLGLVGESGSGKTTIGRTIMGLNDFATGTIFICGKQLPNRTKDISIGMRKELVQRIQMIFQDPYDSLNPNITIFDVISEGLKNIDVKSEEFLNNIRTFISLDLIKSYIMLLTLDSKIEIDAAKKYAQIFKTIFELKQEREIELLEKANVGLNARNIRENYNKIFSQLKHIEEEEVNVNQKYEAYRMQYAALLKQRRKVRKTGDANKFNELTKEIESIKEKIAIEKANLEILKDKHFEELKRTYDIETGKNKTVELLPTDVNVDEKLVKEINKKFYDKIWKTITTTLEELKSKVKKSSETSINSLVSEFANKIAAQENLLKQYSEKAKNESAIVKNSVVTMLRSVGLNDEQLSRYPLEFSGGQMQRIGIARTLVMYPELIIADEPISALDVSIQAQVINILNDLKDLMNLSILFIAHDLKMVKYISDRIAVMHLGDILEMGTSDEIFENPIHPYTKSLLSAVPSIDNVGFLDRKVTYSKDDHKYTQDNQPSWHFVNETHKVLCTDEEFKEWTK